MSAPAITIPHVALPGRAGAVALTLQNGKVAALRTSAIKRAPRWLALPGFANLHAHADRAFTVDAFRPTSFADALAAAAKARAAFTAEDVAARAKKLLERSVAHGVTRIRTHTDVDPIVEMRSMEGLAAARAAMTGKIDVDTIAFSTSRNDLADASAAARLREAIALKPAYLGASLNSSAEPKRALDALLDLAEEFSLPVDLHLDEHLDADKMLTPLVVDAALARGLVGRVTISHLCALSVLAPEESHALIEKLARAEVTVIALPETNLFLQDRGEAAPRRRGVTLARELIAAGAKVRFGTDNVRDWFFPFGDGDMLDSALWAAIAAQIDDPAALLAGVCNGRAGIAVGDVADLVLIPASSLDDALARRPPGRAVFKGGRQVAGPAIA